MKIPVLPARPPGAVLARMREAAVRTGAIGGEKCGAGETESSRTRQRRYDLSRIARTHRRRRGLAASCSFS